MNEADIIIKFLHFVKQNDVQLCSQLPNDHGRGYHFSPVDMPTVQALADDFMRIDNPEGKLL